MSSVLIKIGHWFYVNTGFGKWYFNRTLNQVSRTLPLGHSAPVILDYGTYHVRVVSYSYDNYGFIVWRDNSNKCIIIDPGYFPPFNEIIDLCELMPDTILITHKHYDHCGGLESLIARYPNVKIYSNKKEKVKHANNQIDDAIFTFTACEEEYLNAIFVTAYHTPGHTVGHTVYTINTSNFDESNTKFSLITFTGDAIFMGSIGAIFECTIATNLSSLRNLIMNLIQLNIALNSIILFPGHEYSVSSLQFILTNCSPNSDFCKAKLNWCLEQRNWKLPTIPTTLFDELSYSPYLRIAVATKATEKRIQFKILIDEALIKIYLPKIEDLINEFLFSEKLIKLNLESYYSDTNEEALRIKIFEDLFIEDKKILVKSEHVCSKVLDI